MVQCFVTNYFIVESHQDNNMGRQPQGTTYWSNQQPVLDTQKQLPISNTPQPEHWCTIAYYELDQQVKMIL